MAADRDRRRARPDSTSNTDVTTPARTSCRRGGLRVHPAGEVEAPLDILLRVGEHTVGLHAGRALVIGGERLLGTVKGIEILAQNRNAYVGVVRWIVDVDLASE